MSTNLSSRIRDFIKAEAVLVIAAVAAVASMAAFPLTPATLSTYIGYIDMRTIGLLFCLMTVVAGLGRAGLLNAIRNWLMTRVGSARTLAFILINVVFIAAMLVTNDVALITFVPLALALFMQASPRATIATVVAITVAANLGSMCTPHRQSAKHLFSFRVQHGLRCVLCNGSPGGGAQLPMLRRSHPVGSNRAS